jgi:ribosomal protein S18 acetylase RimI-like enzyme
MTRALSGLTSAELEARQARSQRGFYRALGGGSPGARLAELDGVQATCVPARPWFSIFNSVFYDRVEALRDSLAELESLYREAGVEAWCVWVPPGDDAGAALLAASGFARDSTPLRMAAPIAELDLEPRLPVQLVNEPSWQVVARCNDRAHGVLPDWSMAAVFSTMDDPCSSLHALEEGGEIVAALIAREHEGDCYFWFVATVPEAQRRGLGTELMRHALREARARGAKTTSLESTAAGEQLYAKLGYRPLGRYEMWEHR